MKRSFKIGDLVSAPLVNDQEFIGVVTSVSSHEILVHFESYDNRVAHLATTGCATFTHVTGGLFRIEPSWDELKRVRLHQLVTTANDATLEVLNYAAQAEAAENSSEQLEIDCLYAELRKLKAELKAHRTTKTAKRRHSGKMRKGSQVSRILAYLLLGNPLTPIKARALFGAERLAARIAELKQAGHKITTTIKEDVNGKVYAEYTMRSVDHFGRKKK